MNFTNDSAPLHLCTSVNAPVTAVFCSTTPDFGFTPLSDNSLVIEAEPTPDCKPCGLHGSKQCKKGHFACSRNIDINKLIKRI
jgi:heptosyltransferase-2